MSLTPDFAADAKSQWRELTPEHQEIVLDVVDQVAMNPPADGEHVEDHLHEEGGMLHYIFVHVVVEKRVNTLTIIGVGHAMRPSA